MEKAIEKLELARPHIVLRDVHKKVLNEYYEQIRVDNECVVEGTENKDGIAQNELEKVGKEIDNAKTSNL